MERPIHGAFDYAELETLGLLPQEVVDFSVNSNPYGPSPRVRKAIANIAIDRYPDRACLKLRRAILHHEMNTTNLTLDALVCGNGTAELIWTIASTYLKQGRKAAIVGPTFGEYSAASLMAGAILSEYHARLSEHFQPDSADIATWIEAERPSLVWLCNPNNPTGTWLDREEMLLLAKTCQGSVRTQNAEKLIGWMELLIPRSLTYEAACITL
jgi:histidinol-phosphate aminotransferase